MRIEKTICDVNKCDIEGEQVQRLKFSVVFLTETTGGRATDPYIGFTEVDICPKHLKEMAETRKMLSATGAQGNYTFEL